MHFHWYTCQRHAAMLHTRCLGSDVHQCKQLLTCVFTMHQLELAKLASLHLMLCSDPPLCVEYAYA